MSMFATTYHQAEIDEAISMGMSTKTIAKRLGIPHEVLIRVLQERRAARDEWQQIVNEKYKNKNILEG